jgi:hypothetical protein
MTKLSCAVTIITLFASLLADTQASDEEFDIGAALADLKARNVTHTAPLLSRCVRSCVQAL